jgi:hypothetical protein
LDLLAAAFFTVTPGIKFFLFCVTCFHECKNVTSRG